MQDTRTTFIDVVTAATKALFSQAEKEISGSLLYPTLGYQDGTCNIPDEARNQVSGPSEAVDTEEGVEYAEVEKFRGFPITVNPKKVRSEEHTSELQSQSNLVCRLLLEKKN